MTELLVVMAVVGVLVAIAVPITVRQIRLHTLDSSVSVISNKVKEARMEAIKRNRTSKVRLDLAAGNAQVGSTDNSNTAIDVGYPVLFSKDVVLDSPSSVEISFDSLGRLTPPTQVTVTLLETSSGSRKNIAVSPDGKVTVGPMY